LEGCADFNRAGQSQARKAKTGLVACSSPFLQKRTTSSTASHNRCSGLKPLETYRSCGTLGVTMAIESPKKNPSHPLIPPRFGTPALYFLRQRYTPQGDASPCPECWSYCALKCVSTPRFATMEHLRASTSAPKMRVAFLLGKAPGALVGRIPSLASPRLCRRLEHAHAPLGGRERLTSGDLTPRGCPRESRQRHVRLPAACGVHRSALGT
jgi:hypothetical protein